MTIPRPSLVTSSGPSPVRGFIAAISHPLPSGPNTALTLPSEALLALLALSSGACGGTGKQQSFLSVALLSRVRKQNGNDRSCSARREAPPGGRLFLLPQAVRTPAAPEELAGGPDRASASGLATACVSSA